MKRKLCLLKNKRAEGYIDVCVTVVVFVMLILSIIHVSGLFILHQQVDVVCDNILEAATASGRFDTEVHSMAAAMKAQYFDFDYQTQAAHYHSGKCVQLGEPMTVTVKLHTYFQLFGDIQVPMTITVTKSGLSERYWK